ncbi:MAG TPA: CDP-glycerol glycerophosphotransferase family protein [Pedococcus sp.]
MRWRQSNPQRHLGVAYTGDSITVTFEFAPSHRVSRVRLSPRKAFAPDLWSVELDGTSRGVVSIPVRDLLERFDAAWRATDGGGDEGQSQGVTASAGPAPAGEAMPPEEATPADGAEAVPADGAEAVLAEGVEVTARPPIYADLGFTVTNLEPGNGDPVGPVDVRAAGFVRTEVETSRAIQADSGAFLTGYLTAGGGLSFMFGETQPLPKGVCRVRWVRRHDTSWEVLGDVDTQSFAVTAATLVLVGRRTGERIKLDTTVRPATGAGHGGSRRTGFRATLPQDAVLGVFDRPEYLDARLQLDLEGFTEQVEVAVRRIAPTARLSLPTSVFSDGAHAAELRAYRTFKAGSLALEVRPMDPDAVPLARTAARSGRRLRKQTRNRPVWVVGERPETAQDTGLAMYRYLREQHPEIDARYVITKDSPDRDRFGDDPSVVEFGSRAHVEATLAAQRILSSHHSDYLLAARGSAFQRGVKARRVFLQHGVMGTKNMVANYGYDAPGFTAESFVVSSERERRMIEDDFGWPARRVFVTGLSRHDELFDHPPAPERRLLIMPTWRDWLKTADDVATSTFHERWQGLLSSPDFVSFLRENDLQADFYLHANMQAFAGLFDLSHVNVVTHGEADVQQLLLRSMVMLTDYTSAAIDFAFLDRPVVYYQFDRTRFIGKRPSHFELDDELPGEIGMTVGEVMEHLRADAERGFRISEESRAKAGRLVAYRDGGARERIVEAARETPGRRLQTPFVRDMTGTAQRVWKRVQKKPRYRSVRARVRTPLLEQAYALARRLPRSGMVVFESNLGADLGDSPGAIHAAMRRRGVERPTGWVVTAGLEAPEGSLALTRLGFRYVWEMGRASLWVANQNQPSWMRRPDDTAYLQTWHGTPLKRMLHDLDTIVGRDEGYVGRVDTMISEWSLLLSQSPWATERLRSAFRYRGEVLEVGYPRNDVLADGSADERAAAVRKRLGLARSKKVVVYAPTFRDDQRVGKRFTFALPLDLELMLERLGEDYELVVRLHPVVRGKVRLPDGVHNGGAGVAMQDLLAAADVLITDYSSVMFDYAVLGRPMVFFVPDLESYRDNLRGFYFDFEEQAPGPLVRTTAEVVDLLEHPQRFGDHAAQLARFRDQFCPLDDGHAADRVVDELQRRGLL